MTPRPAPLSLRLKPEVLSQVDESRGSMPRNAWIVSAIEGKLSDHSQTRASLGEKASSGLGGEEVAVPDLPSVAPAVESSVGPPMSFETRVLLELRRAPGNSNLERRKNAEEAVKASMNGESNG